MVVFQRNSTELLSEDGVPCIIFICFAVTNKTLVIDCDSWFFFKGFRIYRDLMAMILPTPVLYLVSRFFFID